MKITPELIDKYLNNLCSAEERKAVDDWYKSFDNHPDPLRLMNQVEQESLKKSIYQRFKESNHKRVKPNDHNSFTNVYTILGAVAGLAALILLLFKPGINQQLPLNKSTQNQVRLIAFRNVSLSLYKKVLPDESTVWLSPNSVITYPAKFTGNLRKVSLTGEAFFEVTPDKKHPFIITSNELTTKVWGTSFRVRALSQLQPEVVVVTGKVSVNQNNSKLGMMLLPGQRVTLINHSKLVKQTSPLLKSEMRIWQKVSLSFDNVKLKDVFAALNKNFDLNIYSTDPKLNALIFTGDFSDQSLPAILDMIEESVNANYSLVGQKNFVFKTNNN